MQLDDKDIELLVALVKNARTPLTVLAKKVHLSLTATKLRVTRLEQRGVIRSYKVTLNHRAFPYEEFDVYYTLTSVSENTVRRALKDLVSSDFTTQVLSTMGYSDIRVTVLAADMQHLQAILQEAEAGFSSHIRSRTILAVTKKYKSSAETFLSALFSKDITLRRKTPQGTYPVAKADLDRTDRLLLEGLAKNPKESYRSLAQHTSLTPEAVSYRVKQLEKRRIILNYTALLNGPLLGYRWAVLLLSLRHIEERESEQLLGFLQAHPNVSSTVETVGSYTMSVTIFGTDLAKLRNTELEVRARFGEHVVEARLLFILENTKYPELPKGILKPYAERNR